MTSILTHHKPSFKSDGPSYIDRAQATGRGVSGYWTFTGKGGYETNAAGASGTLAIKSGMTRTIDRSIRGIAGIGGVSSYATTGLPASSFGVDGANRRTIFVRFKASASSSANNQGGLFTMGAVGTGNNLFTLRQINDVAPDNGPDQWAVDYVGGGISPRLKFILPKTALNVHTIVVTYDGSSLTVYTDGSFNQTQVVPLVTSNSGNFDIGRAAIPVNSPFGTLLWINGAMPVIKWANVQAGSLLWLAGGMPVVQWDTTDVGYNYFAGTVYEVGVSKYDWNARQVREWHAAPVRLLRNRRSWYASSLAGSVITMMPASVTRSGGVGTPNTLNGSPEVFPTSVQPGGGIGVLTIGTFLQLQVATAPPVLASGGIGTPTIVRQAGFWDPVAAASGNWTPVTPAVGG